jgi:hypothetical protein
MLLRLDEQQGSRPAVPVSEEALARLPVSSYQGPPRTGGSSDGKSSSPPPPLSSSGSSAGAAWGHGWEFRALAALLSQGSAGAAAGEAARAGHWCARLLHHCTPGCSSVLNSCLQHPRRLPALRLPAGALPKEEDDTLVCTICLEAVAQGAEVLSLPCCHQFHRECIMPWLRQQGASATCPMCKTNAFQ